MKTYPKRKSLRLQDYDYAADGAYFVTFCAKSRTYVFWEDVGTNSPPEEIPLSDIGKIVDMGIQQIETIYHGVSIDKYCIMPDHIHMLVSLYNYEEDSVLQTGEQCSPLHGAGANIKETHNPTISRIVKQLKGVVTKSIGRSIWQKSFVDRIIRNERGYRAVWEYIHCNPIKLDFAYDNIDFDSF